MRKDLENIPIPTSVWEKAERKMKKWQRTSKKHRQSLRAEVVAIVMWAYRDGFVAGDQHRKLMDRKAIEEKYSKILENNTRMIKEKESKKAYREGYRDGFSDGNEKEEEKGPRVLKPSEYLKNAVCPNCEKEAERCHCISFKL